MEDPFFSALALTARHMCVVLAVRFAPFAAFALLSQRIAAVWRGIVLLAFAGLVLALTSMGAKATLAAATLGLAYYLIVSFGVPLLARLLRAQKLGRGALFSVLFAVYLAVPATFSSPVRALVLIIGWELLLSSYSYCVDTSERAEGPASVVDCLFFLFVNPTLVYSRREGGCSGRSVSCSVRPSCSQTTCCSSTACSRSWHRAPGFSRAP
jgi:hypothetical protein